MPDEVEVDPGKICIQRFLHRAVHGDPITGQCLACWPPAPTNETMSEESPTPREDPS